MMTYQTKLALTFINLSRAIILAFSLSLVFTTIALADQPASSPGAPVRLVIPSIALDGEIVPVGWKEVVVNGQTYAQWLVDDNKVGWHNLSAPLSQVGNTVLNGHSDIKEKIFRHLEEVEIGHEIIAYAEGQAHHYVVTEKLLLQENLLPDKFTQVHTQHVLTYLQEPRIRPMGQGAGTERPAEGRDRISGRDWPEFSGHRGRAVGVSLCYGYYPAKAN
jgi:hypothetical protein